MTTAATLVVMMLCLWCDEPTAAGAGITVEPFNGPLAACQAELVEIKAAMPAVSGACFDRTRAVQEARHATQKMVLEFLIEAERYRLEQLQKAADAHNAAAFAMYREQEANRPPRPAHFAAWLWGLARLAVGL